MAKVIPAKQHDITQGGLLSKLMQHGSVYFVASAILNFTGLLLLPVNTRLFSEAEYGAISTIDSATRVLWVFTSLYLNSAFARFYHEYKDDAAALQRHTSTIYWFLVAWGVMVAVVLLLLMQWFSAIEAVPIWPVIALAFCTPVLMQIGRLGADYLRQNHRSLPNVALSIGNVLLHVLLMLLLVGWFGLGLTGKYIGLLVGALFFAIGGTWMLRQDGLLQPVFSGSMLRESLVYALPLLPEVAAGWIMGFSDRLILSWYGSMSETGIYSAGYTLGKGISMFSEAVYMVYGPLVFAMMKKDLATAKVRLERFALYFFIFMAWMYLALSLFAREAVTLLTTREYVAATVIVPIVMLGYLFSSQYKLFVAILSYQRLTWAISSGAILMALLNLGANFLLIPAFGKVAAAWTTVGSLLLYLVWMFFWSQRSFRLALDYRRMATAAGIIGVMLLLGMGLLPRLSPITLSPIALIGAKLALLGVSAVVIWYSGCILAVDKAQISRQVRNFLPYNRVGR